MSTGAAVSSPAARKPEALNFSGISVDGDPGVFRVLGELCGWKNPRTNEVIQLEASKIEDMDWMRVTSRDFCLSIITRNDSNKVDFMGFKEADCDTINAYIRKKWGRAISSVRLACKGWHWGEHDIKNKRFCMRIDSKRAVEIPLKMLSSVTTNKNELLLELESSNASSSADQVIEMRLCVPPLKEGDAAETAELLKAAILDAAGLAGFDNDVICSFPYKQCQMPPGRFDVQITPNSIKLHGKSADFTITFDNIASAFMLPSNTGAFSHLLLALNTPLKKGQTKYPAVIVQMDEKREVEVSLNVTPEQLEQIHRINPDIKTEMTSLEHSLAGDIFRAFYKRPLIKASAFKSAADDAPCFRCSHKITSGLFYPLEDSFVFIPKPVVIIKFDKIASVDFGRTQGQQTRLFEFQLTLRNGTEIEFSSVDRVELQIFTDFLNSKNLKVRSLTTISKEDRADIEHDEADAAEEDDEEDEEFVEDEEESEEEEEDEE